MSRLLTAAEVAERLHVSRAYVYEHASELGALRLGDGPKAHLRFDEDALACYTSKGSLGLDNQQQRTSSSVATTHKRRRRRSTANRLPILDPWERR